MSTSVEEYPGSGRVDPARLDLSAIVAAARPVVLRGLCRDWPIVARARRSFTEFARAVSAFDNGTAVDVLHMRPEFDGVIGYNDALDGFNYTHFKVSVTDALARLAEYSRVEDVVPGLALQSAPIAACLPGLVDHLPLPCLPEAVAPRLWIGNRVTTPAHFDAFHNLAVVVCGRRRFTLFPADQVANLYIGPLDFAPTGAAITLARPDAPDFARFPRLREALAHAQVAELEAGDALYLPPLWWHQVESLEPLNALVNYWWLPRRTDGRPAMPALEALLHARLAFAALPASERRDWRALFDHYVFGEPEAVAHIPEDRRGVLGDLDDEAMARLRQRIRASLGG